jgi:rod shape-determining protein MreC
LISFALIIQHNDYQHIIFSRYTSALFGSIASFTTGTKDYLHLREINRGLAEENTRLKNQIGAYITEDSTPRTYHQTTDSNVVYDYLSAKVVNITYNRMKNYISINRGTLHGVEREMAVTTPSGVVGIVQDVSDHYSIVIPLINIAWYVSARIKNNNYYGSVQWDGNNYGYSYLKDIPYHVHVTIGDTIITTRHSSIFPEGIVIGTVEKVEKENANFLNIKMKLAVDFKAISDVYLIRNNRKTERKQLEEGYFNYE